MSEFCPEPLNGWKRTHNCGELRLTDDGKQVTLMGWVHRLRNLGGLLFVDLRDREGITQCVFNKDIDAELFEKAAELHNEYVIAVKGLVAPRNTESTNKSLPTKDIEVNVSEMKLLNPCKVLPFQISEEQPTDEGLRMQYRYLDLRKPRLARNLAMRHRITKAVRDHMDSQGFYEIETPILVASTPEGARDYLVPSRIHAGHFYALPQSPQLYKQMCMVGGLDRYFQIARCFRDEDLRADRQPEFTQIDIEMSFVERDDVLDMVEKLMGHVIKAALGRDIPAKFRRMPYSEALERYGSDKPELRLGMEIQNVTEQLSGTGFGVFDTAIANEEAIKAMVFSGHAGASRKEQDALKEMAVAAGLPGLFFIAVTEQGIKSSLLKFLGEERAKALAEKLGAAEGDLVLLACGPSHELSVKMGKLRLAIAAKYELLDPQRLEFLWVIDFPMFSWSEEEDRLVAEHHPFTSPLPEDLKYMQDEPLKVRAAAYDLVLNGCELASGSVRIHQRPLQEQILERIGLTLEEAKQKFGFLLNAFEYGAPPHAGIALGLDRLTAICCGEASIREVIAFPKNTNAADLMSGAPVIVTDEQLKSVHLDVTEVEEM
ncbi:aspartate--tRNA ligase [bacterium]|nr:aspartate--tRNA ligase [bacterium]